MGLPIGAVKNALVRDGKDPSIMDLDPNKSTKSQLEKDEDVVFTGNEILQLTELAAMKEYQNN